MADIDSDEIPAMCDRGYVANGDNTARDIKPTNRRNREVTFFMQIRTSQSPVTREHHVFRMWLRTKPIFHACISSILHITHRTHRNVKKKFQSIEFY